MDELESETRIVTLPQLQNLIRRDPTGHYNEFQQQKAHFDAHVQLLSLQPGSCDNDFAASISFMCHVVPCFATTETKDDFPDQILTLLKNYGMQMHANIRLQLCKGLVMMMNRGFGSIEIISPVLFRLLETQDKPLREFILESIVHCIKRMNKKQIDQKLNSRLQHSFYESLKAANAIGNTSGARIIVQILTSLVRRNVWKDAKVLNFLAEAVFIVKNKAVLVMLLRFLLNNKPAGEEENDTKANNSDSDDDDDDSDDELAKTNIDLMLQHRVGKKSKKRSKRLKRALLRNAQKQKKRNTNAANRGSKRAAFDSGILQLIYDPQTYTERLFQKLQKAQDKFEIKILMFDLISRLIGIHKLIILNFYPYLVRFMQPHQRDVTKVLLFAAQSTHDQVPPDCLETLINAVANNFVTERNSSEVMTVGLNTIREIASRAPFALSDSDLVRDLTAYNSYKNKNVRAAAQSLVQLFRFVDPKMLHRRDRGRPTAASKEDPSKLKQFGEKDDTKGYLMGAEVLLNRNADADDAEEAENDAKSDDGSWIDIPDDGDIDMSDVDNDDDEEDDDDDDEEEEQTDDENDETGVVDVAEKKKSEIKPADAVENVAVNPVSSDAEPPAAPVEQSAAEAAAFVSSDRLLTQREHEILRKRQLAKFLQKVNVNKNNGKQKGGDKDMLDLDALERNRYGNNSDGGPVSMSDIERLVKRPKLSREERYAVIKQSKADSKNEKRANKKQSFRRNPYASTTNKEKAKLKAFAMVRPKQLAKKKQSFKVRQQKLKQSLLAKIKMEKKKKH